MVPRPKGTTVFVVELDLVTDSARTLDLSIYLLMFHIPCEFRYKTSKCKGLEIAL